MRTGLLALLAAMLTAGWHITWDARLEQSSLVVVTECKGPVPYFAYDQIPLNENQTEATVRRQPTPRAERCTVQVSLMVDPEEDGNETIADSIIVIQED